MGVDGWKEILLQNRNTNSTKLLSMAYKHRIKYGILVIPSLIVCMVLTFFFESQAYQQTTIAHINMLLQYLIVLRIINWLFVLCNVLIGIGIVFLSQKHATFSFGWANILLILCIASLFTTLPFEIAIKRYQNEQLVVFNLKTKESRDFVDIQFNFLNNVQKKFKCCGLNDYTDYKKDNSSFDVIGKARSDELDQQDQLQNNTILWKDYLTGANVTYMFTRNCNETEERTFAFHDNVKLDPDEDVPKACCKTNVDDCNKNVEADLEKIYTDGCREKVLPASKKLKPLVIIFYIYPWIVFIYCFIITWAYRCEVLGLPFSLFHIPIVKVKPS